MFPTRIVLVLATVAATTSAHLAGPRERHAILPRATSACSPVAANTQPGLTCDVAGRVSSPAVLATFHGTTPNRPVSCAATCLGNSSCLAFAYNVNTNICTTYAESVASMSLIHNQSAPHAFWDRACYTCAPPSTKSKTLASSSSSSTTLTSSSASTTTYMSSSAASTTTYMSSSAASTTTYISSSTVPVGPACATQPVQNPSFESGTSPWITNGDATFTTPQDSCNAYSGEQSMRIFFSYTSDFDPNGGSDVTVSQPVTLCPSQSYTVQFFVKSSQLVNMDTCFARACVNWVLNSYGDTYGGYCDDGIYLTENYTQISGNYPPNPNADAAADAYIEIYLSCYQIDPSQASYGFVYLDDFTMVNQAFPAAAVIPVPNATPTTACSPVSYATPTPTCASYNELAIQQAAISAQDTVGHAQFSINAITTLIGSYQDQIAENQQTIVSLQADTNPADHDSIEAAIKDENDIIATLQQAVSDLNTQLQAFQQLLKDGQLVLSYVQQI